MENIKTIPVTILANTGERHQGSLSLREWTDHERKSRALKKTFKILGSIFGVSLIGLFVHILLIIILPALLVTLLASYPMYLKFSSEKNTIQEINGYCPTCKKNSKLRPYISTQFEEKTTVQCPDCGQTVQIEQGNSLNPDSATAT